MNAVNFVHEKSYKINYGYGNIFLRPTSVEDAYITLAEYFLGSNWYTANPVTHEQAISEQILQIMKENESFHFRMLPWWKRLQYRIICFFTGRPIYLYY